MSALVPPGEALRSLLEERKISQSKLSLYSGINRGMIGKIVRGKSRISETTDQKLSAYLNTPAGYWLDIQKVYDGY